MADKEQSKKPAVLIVGGLGYIGRFLAKYVHDNDLASEVRIVDKVLPELARLPPEFKEACSRDKFMQADAGREQFTSKIFNPPVTSSKKQYDYVFNCAGETRYSLDSAIYRSRVHDLSLALGREAARRRTPCFVECSTGQIYSPTSTPSKETDKTKPWTKIAKAKLAAEEEMAKLDGLNLVVLRFANVYGPYTTSFLSTALCMARVYQDLDKGMKWLWDAGLMINTVHIVDATRALWHAADWYMRCCVPDSPGHERVTSNTSTLSSSSKSRKASEKGSKDSTVPAAVFNIVDHGRTSQGTLSTLIASHFHIATGFQGTLISSFARLNLDSVVDDVNDETLDPWAELQEQAGIEPGPISPFLEKELLKDNDLCLDGSAFEERTGFRYVKDALTEESVAEVVDSYKKMKWWP